MALRIGLVCSVVVVVACIAYGVVGSSDAPPDLKWISWYLASGIGAVALGAIWLGVLLASLLARND